MQKAPFALLLLAAWGTGWTEESWLAAEIRAQEARWEAQQDKTAAPQPLIAWPATAIATTHALRKRERRVSFPALASAPAAHPRLIPAVAYAPASTAPLSVPDSPEKISELILASARQQGLDPLLIRAVILTESAGRVKARSPKGAIGLMQLMPGTAARFGVNPHDPAQNIAGGAEYLRWLLNYFNGDVRMALAGYNAGEGAVNRYGGIPPYRETQNYVRRVQGFHQTLQRVAYPNQ